MNQIENERPFTDHVTRTKARFNGALPGWIAAGMMTAVAALMLALWYSARTRQLNEITSLHARLSDAESELANAARVNGTNQQALAALKLQVADLERDRESGAQMSKSLEEEMRSELESKDVTISKLQGRLTVNILDRVLFDSGEAVLKPDGQAVMRKIASILSGHPELKIHVIGHTDNVPIRPAAQARFKSNWELSSARALAAVHFLTEQAGIDARRMGALGYGEFRPIADNSTPEGRARNRRIAIVVLPEELAGSEGPPATKSAVETNSAPSVATPSARALPTP